MIRGLENSHCPTSKIEGNCVSSFFYFRLWEVQTTSNHVSLFFLLFVSCMQGRHMFLFVGVRPKQCLDGVIIGHHNKDAQKYIRQVHKEGRAMQIRHYLDTALVFPLPHLDGLGKCGLFLGIVVRATIIPQPTASK